MFSCCARVVLLPVFVSCSPHSDSDLILSELPFAYGLCACHVLGVMSYNMCKDLDICNDNHIILLFQGKRRSVIRAETPFCSPVQTSKVVGPPQTTHWLFVFQSAFPRLGLPIGALPVCQNKR